MMTRTALAALALLTVLAAAPGARAQSPTIRLTFEGDPGLTVQRFLGQGWVMQGYTGYNAARPSAPLYGAAAPSPRDHFERLCSAPCAIDVAPGLYHFGVSQGPYGMAFRGGDTVELTTDATFRIGYESRTWARVIGWVTFIGGLVAGLGFVTWGALTDQISDPLPWMIPAIGAGVAGMAVGIPLIALTDHASVELVTP